MNYQPGAPAEFFREIIRNALQFIMRKQDNSEPMRIEFDEELHCLECDRKTPFHWRVNLVVR